MTMIQSSDPVNHLPFNPAAISSQPRPVLAQSSASGTSHHNPLLIEVVEQHQQTQSPLGYRCPIDSTDPCVFGTNVPNQEEGPVFVAPTTDANCVVVHFGENNIVDATQTQQNCEETSSHTTETQLYRRRFVVLAIFILLSASNSMQWIEYSIISHVITHYYSVSYPQVDWTSMTYMFTYVLLVVPGSWFLDKYGLRKSLLIGAVGNCFGAWLKILSAARDRFWLTFLAQTIVGSSQVFILGIPPRLAAVWFGPDEVSTACAAGVFGNQLGIAIGFVLPPLLVHQGPDEQMTAELRHLFAISAIGNTLILLLVMLFFCERPLRPPSLARAQAIEGQCQPIFIGEACASSSSDHHQQGSYSERRPPNGNNNNNNTNTSATTPKFTSTILALIRDRNYVLLLITYGINVGVFYAVSTLLSQIVLHYHTNSQESTGTIGLLIVVSGLAGSVLCGYVLDRFHCYKATTLVVYFFSFIGMVLFTGVLPLSKQLWTIFCIAAILGFFMTGYLPIGFEFAAEITYPIAEGTTSGLLNGAAQVFGITMTIGMGHVIASLSVFWCNVIMSLFLLVGTILTALIRADLKRQRAQQEIHNRNNSRRELDHHQQQQYCGNMMEDGNNSNNKPNNNSRNDSQRGYRQTRSGHFLNNEADGTTVRTPLLSPPSYSSSSSSPNNNHNSSSPSPPTAHPIMMTQFTASVVAADTANTNNATTSNLDPGEGESNLPPINH